MCVRTLFLVVVRKILKYYDVGVFWVWKFHFAYYCCAVVCQIDRRVIWRMWSSFIIIYDVCVLGMISATEINALRLEIIDGVNQLLKLPLISYVIDNTKTMINQVIIIMQPKICWLLFRHTYIISLNNEKYNIILSARHLWPIYTVLFCFSVYLVLRIHRLK